MRHDIKNAEMALAAAHAALQELARNLDHFKLLDGDNPIVKTEWHARDEIPPVGHVWASDGNGVWLIHSEGLPIPEHATAVKFWTQAFIPCPPNHRPTIDSSASVGGYVQVPTEYCGTPGAGGAEIIDFYGRGGDG
ncbi:MAG: hypothetical protein P8Y47_04890 [Alphaproteobacteria bacterium]